MLFLRQAEGFHHQDRHTGAGDGVIGTEFAVAAARGDAFDGQLLDPRSSPIRSWYIDKAGAATHGGRGVSRPVLGAQEEDGHFSIGGFAFRAVQIGTASAGDAFG